MDAWRKVLADSDPAAGHFLLVALEGDRVLGYAKSGTFMLRAAYDSTCLASVYVAAGARGRGVGTALYARLFELLDASPLHLATAGITEPNEASTALHLAFGFQRVGTFDDVGVKFGKPWSVTWYQRPLI
jgi:phosphinothricin acetyltransferase